MKDEKHLGLKLTTIILAMIYPIIVLLSIGQVKSFSVTWNTDLQPLFIFTNAITSYFLFSSDRWRFSALFLLLLTCISVEFSSTFHDLLAAIFFISCIKPMLAINRLKPYVILYILSVPTIFMVNLFWFETVAVWILCLYHLHYLFVKINLQK